MTTLKLASQAVDPEGSQGFQLSSFRVDETPKPPVEAKTLEHKNIGQGERIHPRNSATAD